MSEDTPADSWFFGEFRLNGSGLFRLTRTGNEKPVSLGTRALDILLLLARRHGEVVSKDAILQTVWAGTAIEENNLTVQISALRRVLDRNRKRGSCIQTIAGRGYRFAATTTNAKPIAEAGISEPPLPAKPSVAVLPFANLSSDPGQDYFADGMVDEITTALARNRALFVIARHSAFTYKGQAIDVKQVGRQLGVRYLLQGSVRRSSSHLRVTAQLVDASTGEQLWSDHFDGALTDVFELQEKVAFEAAGIIEIALTRAETGRSMQRKKTDLTTYDLYLRATTVAWTWNRTNMIAALDLLGRAIKRDPDYGPALALASGCYTNLHIGQLTADLDGARREALDFARRALRSAGDDPNVLGYAALAFGYFDEDIGAAIALVDRAIELNPSSARGWATRAWLVLWAGRPEVAIADFATTLRLSPREIAPNWLIGMGIAYFFMHRFTDAERMLLQSLQGHPNWPPTYRFLAACYAHTGRIEEARRTVEQLKNLTSVLAPALEHWRKTEHQDFYMRGLRLAIGDAEQP
ncbi:MAG TPA: winged helix-turn-helix domain-containing protein [Stellaceae bacterium]|nr:winged helix-turn-helix domain-containing protein [Stellaceae bacterium]